MIINVSSVIRKIVDSTYWGRGASYANQKKIPNVEVLINHDAIILKGEVYGTSTYHTGLQLYTSGQLGASCTCLAFGPKKFCKHVAGFARRIDQIYRIDESSLEVWDMSTQTSLGKPDIMAMNRDTQMSSLRDDTTTTSKNPEDYRVNSDALASFPIDVDPNDPEVIDFLLKHKPEMLIRKEKKVSPQDAGSTSKTLSLLATLIPSEKDISPQKYYRIKVGIAKYRTHNDLYLHLFEAKLLKNGNLSTGVELTQEKISSQELMPLRPFLEKKYDYYGSPRLSFRSAPEFYIRLLQTSQYPITLIDNTPIHITSGISRAELKIEKSSTNKPYSINLILVNQDGTLLASYDEIQGSQLVNAPYTQYYAIKTLADTIIFFTTVLPLALIESIIKKPLSLSKKEWQEFRTSGGFEPLLDQCHDTDFLADELTDSPLPKIRLIITIDSNFESIMLSYDFLYDTVHIHPMSNKKIITHAGGIFTRDITGEKDEYSKILPLLKMADIHDSQEAQCIKYIDTYSDTFFDTIESLVESGIQVEYKQPTKRVSSSSLSAQVQVSSGEDWFDMNVVFSIGDRELEQSREILMAMKHGGKYITLDNGTAIKLKTDIQKTLKEWDELGINEKNINETIKVGKYSIGLLKETSKNDFSEFHLGKDVLQLKKSLENFSGIKSYDLPEGVQVELRDYQHQGYNWLRFLHEHHFSGILADDMGLGKTIQTLVFLQYEHGKKSTKHPSLIVVPTSLVLNWIDETTKFVPKLRIAYIKDGKTGFSDIPEDIQIIVVSYGTISNLIEEPSFDKKKFHYVILDEAQNIKNLATARTQSVMKLKASYRLALSGTPIENNLMELFSIFNFLMPGFIGTESKFKEKYTKGDIEGLDILSRKVKPFILRRKKEDVLKDLPAKQEEVIHLEMGQKQRDFYNTLKTTYRAQISKQIAENGLAKSQFAVLDALLKLRQACLMPRLVNLENNTLDESIKLEYIEENIEEMINAGHNLLIFSQFTGFLAFVRQILDKKGVPYNYLDGSTKREDRKKLVDHFNAGGVPVFLISLKAGGTGLNLTRADYVIHLDPWWNPAVENQTTDRAHRMGQSKTVFVQKLIVRDTVEEKILKLQEKKKKLIDDLFSGDFRGNLSEEDIGYIFE